jgi:predicted nucleotidyltransferase
VLDGSLAMGALWPTSDLDFTVVPLAEKERQLGADR